MSAMRRSFSQSSNRAGRSRHGVISSSKASNWEPTFSISFIGSCICWRRRRTKASFVCLRITQTNFAKDLKDLAAVCACVKPFHGLAFLRQASQAGDQPEVLGRVSFRHGKEEHYPDRGESSCVPNQGLFATAERER